VAIRGGAQSAVVKEILTKFDEKITMVSKSTGRANDVAVVPKREVKAGRILNTDHTGLSRSTNQML
jgi:hypothetical protein